MLHLPTRGHLFEADLCLSLATKDQGGTELNSPASFSSDGLLIGRADSDLVENSSGSLTH